MKKFFLFLSLIFAVSVSHAAWLETYQYGSSSFTLTNETTARISSSSLKGGVFLGVVIDSPSLAGTLTLADASVSTSVAGIVYSTFAIVSLSGTGNTPVGGPYYIPFNVYLSSGLAYTTSGNAGGITLIYKKFTNLP